MLRPDPAVNLSKDPVETARKAKVRDKVLEIVRRETGRLFLDKVDDPGINSAAKMPDPLLRQRQNRNRCDPRSLRSASPCQ